MSRSQALPCSRRRHDALKRFALAALALAGGLASAADEASSAVRGRQLFVGDIPLAARILGQDFALPAQASRCVNCHGPGAAATGASAAASAPSAAPAL